MLCFSEFCVSVAGYRPSGPIRTPLFEPSYSTPTLHVLGRTDVVVVEERSNQLVEVSADKRVEYHPGGAFYLWIVSGWCAVLKFVLCP